MAEIEEEKVAAIHLGQIPKQAERQNKFHFMFDLIRSDFSDTALEESFKVWQEEIIKKLSTHGLEYPVELTGKSI